MAIQRQDSQTKVKSYVFQPYFPALEPWTDTSRTKHNVSLGQSGLKSIRCRSYAGLLLPYWTIVLTSLAAWGKQMCLPSSEVICGFIDLSSYIFQALD